MGHGLHRDTLKNALISAVQMLILAVLAWLTLRTESLYTSFGFDFFAQAAPPYGNYGFAVILIMSVEFALISPLYQLFANAFSRRN
jgi:STE24 endopeptidase